MQRLCWLLTGAFALATMVLVYLFVVRGATVPAGDGRSAILLEPSEREFVLGEMRTFLAAVQSITEGVVNQDPVAVAAAARQVGTSAGHQVPTTLVGKLPLAFKRLGLDTHDRFDQLALNVAEFGDNSQVLPDLAELMRNCVACHAAYRIELER